jgi:hypothetical protein
MTPDQIMPAPRPSKGPATALSGAGPAAVKANAPETGSEPPTQDADFGLAFLATAPSTEAVLPRAALPGTPQPDAGTRGTGSAQIVVPTAAFVPDDTAAPPDTSAAPALAAPSPTAAPGSAPPKDVPSEMQTTRADRAPNTADTARTAQTGAEQTRHATPDPALQALTAGGGVPVQDAPRRPTEAQTLRRGDTATAESKAAAPAISGTVNPAPAPQIQPPAQTPSGEMAPEDMVPDDAELRPADPLRADQARADPARHDAAKTDMPRSVGPQLVEAVRQGRDGTVDVALNPEELGRVRLSLSGTDGQIHVAIQAERPETQDLLRRHIAQLQQDFRDLGYAEVTFDFGQSARDRGTRDPDRTPPGAADTQAHPAPGPDAVAPAASARGTATASASLDLRL